MISGPFGALMRAVPSISKKVERSPELNNLLPQLETAYDLRVESKEGEGVAKLSSEIEEILWRTTGKDSGKA